MRINREYSWHSQPRLLLRQLLTLLTPSFPTDVLSLVPSFPNNWSLNNAHVIVGTLAWRPRSICYWINSAVNLAFLPQPFLFINPLGQPTPAHECSRIPDELWNQPGTWAFSPRVSACLVPPQRPEPAHVVHNELTGHVVTAIKMHRKDSSSIKSWTLFIAHLKQTLPCKA